MTGPRHTSVPVDDDGVPVRSRRNGVARHEGPSPRGDVGPEPGVSVAGRPPAGGSPDRGPGVARQGWRLPATAGSVTELRRGLSQFLCGSVLSDEERYDLLLAVCEATSNAVEHPREPSEPFVDIAAGIDDTGVITITVRDHGKWRDALAGTHRGRGLAMMWTLAATTIASGPQGTTVTIRSSPRHGRQPVASHGGPEAAASGRTLPSSAVAGA